MVDSVNLYSAPESDTAEASLPLDTEFLVSDRHLAVPAVARLPEVCVVTGQTTDLLSRSSQLTWCPRWLTLPRNIFVVIYLLIIIPKEMDEMTRTTLAPPPPTSLWRFVTPEVVLFVSSGMVVLAFFVSWLIREHITVHWYVGQQLKNRDMRQLLTQLAVMAGICTLLLVKFGPTSIVELAPVLAIMSTVLLTGMGARTAPRVLGKVESLYILGNLSAAFIAELHSMIARHQARQETKRPPPSGPL